MAWLLTPCYLPYLTPQYLSTSHLPTSFCGACPLLLGSPLTPPAACLPPLLVPLLLASPQGLCFPAAQVWSCSCCPAPCPPSKRRGFPHTRLNREGKENPTTLSWIQVSMACYKPELEASKIRVALHFPFQEPVFYCLYNISPIFNHLSWSFPCLLSAWDRGLFFQEMSQNGLAFVKKLRGKKKCGCSVHDKSMCPLCLKSYSTSIFWVTGFI